MVKKKRDYKAESLALHKKLGGKIEIAPRALVKNLDDLSLLYTPGVGEVSSYLAAHPEKIRDYTIQNRMIAVVTDGSAVLGLGNIGPGAAMPVMEGKSVLFKSFAGVDAFPIALDTQDTDEIVETVKRIAPTFGGINLEDISAPRCFEVEERLKKELSIPVFHDDQHGTAIVVLAGLINACKVTKRKLSDSWVVVNGVGAAGVATIKLMHAYAPKAKILAVDSTGVIWKGRKNLPEHKARLIKEKVIFAEEGGDLAKALIEADIFIGVSRAGALNHELIARMQPDPIIFALANPTPEIMPDEAKRAGVRVMATGRSDFPNQVNNSLVFPGIFRGALDRGVRDITEEMKVRAAKKLAAVIKRPTSGKFIPSSFDKSVVRAVASAIC